jgi:hypothetical protein
MSAGVAMGGQPTHSVPPPSASFVPFEHRSDEAKNKEAQRKDTNANNETTETTKSKPLTPNPTQQPFYGGVSPSFLAFIRKNRPELYAPSTHSTSTSVSSGTTGLSGHSIEQTVPTTTTTNAFLSPSSSTPPPHLRNTKRAQNETTPVGNTSILTSDPLIPSFLSPSSFPPSISYSPSSSKSLSS